MNFTSQIRIGTKEVSESGKVFVIAEAGVNHGGDMALAKEMIDVAAEAGADAVKFQNFKAHGLILQGVDKAPYQKKTSAASETQYDMLRRLEVKYSENIMLQKYCERRGILFLSTPFEEESLHELCDMDIPAIKIAATDITNIQFLRQVARKGKPIILSAGMCYLEEISKALEAISEFNRDVILLQCTANYPIRDFEVNLRVIRTLQKEFNILTGYSDHSVGIGAAPYAVAAGARLIEKHFTLSRKLEGPDQKASVEPDELREMIVRIRQVEEFLGNAVKTPTLSEQFTRKSLQKCIVAKSRIKCGERFTEDNLTAKRTNGVGISAIYFDDVVGKQATRDYEVDAIIEVE
ncbi:MAG: N-acetylneuraminate synthase [bacterium]|nr:N-acetylneuraminate synthase [bacterium]MCM1374861.1 N-acetylneuraminate synthase [Muribaculum sp.]